MDTIKSQRKQYGPRFFTENGHQYRITAEVRHDDECNNGHNSFSITATIDEKRGSGWREFAGGMCHDDVEKHFPELAPYLKWHLTSTDGPMHYVANTLYWLGYSGYCDGKPNSPPNLDHARSTAVWPDMPESFLSGNGMTKEQVAKALQDRQEGLIAEFRKAVESLGLTY